MIPGRSRYGVRGVLASRVLRSQISNKIICPSKHHLAQLLTDRRNFDLYQTCSCRRRRCRRRCRRRRCLFPVGPPHGYWDKPTGSQCGLPHRYLGGGMSLSFPGPLLRPGTGPNHHEEVYIRRKGNKTGVGNPVPHRAPLSRGVAKVRTSFGDEEPGLAGGSFVLLSSRSFSSSSVSLFCPSLSLSLWGFQQRPVKKSGPFQKILRRSPSRHVKNLNPRG